MKSRVWVATAGAMSLLFAVACMERAARPGSDEPAQNTASRRQRAEDEQPILLEERGGGGMRGSSPAAPPASKAAPADGFGAIGYAAGEIDAVGGNGGGDDKEGEAGPAGEPASTRSWFPESFLWAPVVETSAEGIARVPLTVPDSLTTWRVLALASSRAGAQAGTEASFLSTLPAYVDMVVPGSLYAGDEVALPVQVVNTTGTAISLPLDVTMTGARGGGSGQLAVGAGGSASRVVRAAVGGPGVATFVATFGNLDRVERSVPVLPVGMPVQEQRAGSMATDRELSFPGFRGGEHGQLVVTAWPGALAMVRNEVAAGGGED